MKWSMSLLILMVIASMVSAQQDSTDVDTSKGATIVVINADLNEGVDKGGQMIHIGNVILRHDSTIIYADTVRMNSELNRAHATGNVTIQRSDTSSAFCKELDYLGDQSRAIMKGDAAIQHGRQRLFGQYLTYNLKSNVASYSTLSTLTDGERQVTSRHGRYLMDQALAIFSDSVVLAGPDYVMATDSLHFHPHQNRAVIHAPFRVKQGARDIYAKSGAYDLATQSADLFGRAQFSEPGKAASADTIYFDGVTNDVRLIGDARYLDGERLYTADSMEYAPSRDTAILAGHVDIQTPDQSLTGERVTMRISDESVSAEGRTSIFKEGRTLMANHIIDLGEGQRLAQGAVMLIDTSQGIRLSCMEVLLDEMDEEVRAYGEGLMLVKYLDQDSLVLTADTLHLMGGDTSTGQQMLAYHHVVAHKSDLQFVADFLRYDEANGRFYMHGDPKVWSDSSLMYADTIVLTLVDNKLRRMDLIDHAMLLQLKPYGFYDQVKGKLIIAKLDTQTLSEVHVTGNAQSVYYALDEQGGYVGVNEVDCSGIKLVMRQGQVAQIRFYTEPTSQFHPMKAVNHTALRLEGFDAEDTLRPRSPLDIYRVCERLCNR